MRVVLGFDFFEEVRGVNKGSGLERRFYIICGDAGGWGVF